jgi:hypothetical protein
MEVDWSRKAGAGFAGSTPKLGVPTSRDRGVLFVLVALVIGAILLSACGTTSPAGPSASTSSGANTTQGSTSVTAAPDTNTPGDIPDTTAYVTYVNGPGRYQFSHPEGWAQSEAGTSVSFTDKLNGVSASVAAASAAPSAGTARSTDVPRLMTTEPAFSLVSVSAATLPAGTGVLIIYRRNSPPDAVTGKSVRQEVDRYEIFGTARVVVLELFGAVGADNVDPYTKMSQSLRLS